VDRPPVWSIRHALPAAVAAATALVALWAAGWPPFGGDAARPKARQAAERGEPSQEVWLRPALPFGRLHPLDPPQATERETPPAASGLLAAPPAPPPFLDRPVPPAIAATRPNPDLATMPAPPLAPDAVGDLAATPAAPDAEALLDLPDPGLPPRRPFFESDRPAPTPPRRPRDLVLAYAPSSASPLAATPAPGPVVGLAPAPGPVPPAAAVAPPVAPAVSPPVAPPVVPPVAPPVKPAEIAPTGPGGDGELGSPVFVRIFKREGSLELYVKKAGRFTLKKRFDVCKMSGRIGPKLKSGDYQAPEGFYAVTANQLNPNSQYHLAFNVGYPNAFDRQKGRTGSAIMVHGDCVSIGCFAMTNKGIEEIYGYVAAALKGGQREVPVHIFPFRMTASAMAGAGATASRGGLAALFTPIAAGTSENAEFWRNLKEGYDVFESTGQPPAAYACKGRYAFSAGPGCQRIAGW
jgi:hypothetical protein